MLEEAAVFNGDDGMNEIRRNLVVGEEAALGALRALAQAGDEQRLELVAGKLLAVRVGDRIHHAAADVDGGAVGRVIRLRAGLHRDLLHAFAVGSQLRSLRCAVTRVAGIAQLIGDPANGELLPGPHLARRGINLGCAGEDWLLQPRINNALDT